VPIAGKTLRSLCLLRGSGFDWFRLADLLDFTDGADDLDRHEGGQLAEVIKNKVGWIFVGVL